MPAVYPGSLRSFTTKVNNVDIIDAAHPNTIQEELVAVQTTLGVNPQVSTTPTPGWTATSTAYTSVADRLANIERGLVSDTHTQYVSKSGGSVITSTTSATKGLVVKGASAQSANLQEWQASDGSVVAYVSPTGAFVGSTTNQELDNLKVVSWVFG